MSITLLIDGDQIKVTLSSGAHRERASEAPVESARSQ
jgi:hypothetical protein